MNNRCTCLPGFVNWVLGQGCSACIAGNYFNPSSRSCRSCGSNADSSSTGEDENNVMQKIIVLVFGGATQTYTVTHTRAHVLDVQLLFFFVISNLNAYSRTHLLGFRKPSLSLFSRCNHVCLQTRICRVGGRYRLQHLPIQHLHCTRKFILFTMQ